MSHAPSIDCFEELYEHAPCAYLVADADGYLRRVNETFLDWSGLERADLESGERRMHDVFSVGGRILLQTNVMPMIRLQGMAREIALEVVCADGHRLPVVLNAVMRKADDGTMTLLVALFDARERRSYERELLNARNVEREARERTEELQRQLSSANDELQRLTGVDDLTGLANRRAVQPLLARAAARARRHSVPFGVAILDVDNFKRVNDTYGHLSGDAVLRAVGERLRTSVRTEDVVARWGGEEFMILAGDTTAAGMRTLCETLRRSIADEPVAHGDHDIALTASIGWASWCDETIDELVGAADDALYRAKGAGRNRVVAAREVAPR